MQRNPAASRWSEGTGNGPGKSVLTAFPLAKEKFEDEYTLPYWPLCRVPR